MKNLASSVLTYVIIVLSLVLLGAPSGAQAQVINTLEYFLTDNETIELNTGTAGNTLSQKTTANAVVRVKWRTPKAHEYYTWDSNYIYLRYDSTWGFDPIYHPYANSYEFTQVLGKGAPWMKRQMTVGVPMTVTTSAKWYRDNCSLDSTHTATYTNTIIAYYPAFNLGGDLGTDEVIVLKYDWGVSPGSNYEYFYFSKKWGWVRWEHYVNGVVQSSETTKWNRISSQAAVAPQAKCVAIPQPCAPVFNGCPGIFESTGRQCLVQPPLPGECQAGFDWCFSGCCSRCR